MRLEITNKAREDVQWAYDVYRALDTAAKRESTRSDGTLDYEAYNDLSGKAFNLYDDAYDAAYRLRLLQADHLGL